jgi:hypothetical protein
MQRSVYTGYMKVHGFKALVGRGPFCCRFYDTSILDESGILDLLRTHFILEGATLVNAGRALFFSLFGYSGGMLEVFIFAVSLPCFFMRVLGFMYSNHVLPSDRLFRLRMHAQGSTHTVMCS